MSVCVCGACVRCVRLDLLFLERAKEGIIIVGAAAAGGKRFFLFFPVVTVTSSDMSHGGVGRGKKDEG